MSIRQQIVISGVGGQGVLFVTRLLAEAAIRKGMNVLTSETHGMAQRGGTVLSHLKIGDFSSPLIRPGYADGLLAMKAENTALHDAYVRSGGWRVINSADKIQAPEEKKFIIDADALALSLGNPKALNLIVLGFALSQFSKHVPDFFCSPDDIKTVLSRRTEDPAAMLKALESASV